MAKRPGTKDVQITFRMTSEELERLDKMVDKMRVPRHRLIHNLFIQALETLEQLDSVGIVKATMMIRSAEEFLKGKSSTKIVSQP